MPDPEDFYIENGLYVFTESYHLKRGYCCKNACRHCPWGYAQKIPEKNKNEEDSEKSRKDSNN